MKKIGVACIILDHLKTLNDARTGKISVADLLTFYALPIAVGGCAWVLRVDIPDGIESALIAVFAVFAALLFSAQIGVYGLFSRGISRSNDEIEEKLNELRRLDRKKFFLEVNANLSYLILVSIFLLAWLVVALFLKKCESVEDAITLGVVVHFLETLIMVVKRVHIAFASSYNT